MHRLPADASGMLSRAGKGLRVAAGTLAILARGCDAWRYMGCVDLDWLRLLTIRLLKGQKAKRPLVEVA